MKIAMTSLYLPGGSKIGVGYQVHHMANQLVQRGHSVTVYSQCGPGEDALYEACLVQPGKRWRTFGFAWDLREVDFSGFDVLHAHGDDWFLWGRKRPRHIHTYHGSCLAESGHQINFRERVRMLALAACEYGSLGLCDESVAVSEGTRVYIPGIRHVIPNGVELRQFYPSAEKADRPTCLFVGALQGRKRGKLLVELFQKEVLSELPNASLWAVCDEPVEGKGVEWFGRVSTALLCELYRRAWVFCLPSSYEGFGVPYIEAMASGTAVVATPNRGALEVLQNGTCGIISGEERLGRRLIQVLRDSRLREFLERKGLERAQSYGWDIVCRAYEALYRGESMSREVRESKELVV
jgi:phosphatidylinositol alpha-mannosyltransferase